MLKKILIAKVLTKVASPTKNHKLDMMNHNCETIITTRCSFECVSLPREVYTDRQTDGRTHRHTYKQKQSHNFLQFTSFNWQR